MNISIQLLFWMPTYNFGPCFFLFNLILWLYIYIFPHPYQYQIYHNSSFTSIEWLMIIKHKALLYLVSFESQHMRHQGRLRRLHLTDEEIKLREVRHLSQCHTPNDQAKQKNFWR